MSLDKIKENIVTESSLFESFRFFILGMVNFIVCNYYFHKDKIIFCLAVVTVFLLATLSILNLVGFIIAKKRGIK